MEENNIFLLASKICEELAQDCITKEDAISVVNLVLRILAIR